MELKRRANGKGCAVFLGSGRAKPWGARITLGLDKDGLKIRHILGTFDNKLDALFCLEQYHKDPKPIYIQTSKYNRIASFSAQLYPLVPVDNPRNQIMESINKANYTFKQVFEIFKKAKLPTEEEMQLEKDKNIKPIGKFTTLYSIRLSKAFVFSKNLHNMIYKNLTASNFQSVINQANTEGYSYDFQQKLISLFKHMDKYALQDNIISRGYAEYLSVPIPKTKKVQKTIFSPEEILGWEHLQTNTYLNELTKNIFIFSLYSGCRISEILYLTNKNIFLDKGYMITGVKTEAGINREIPIHPKLLPIIEKYYNRNNKFLFTYNDKAVIYATFCTCATRLMKKHTCLGKHSIHECRHTFRTELEQLNIKQVIINSILGHKNNNVGLDTYTHISLEEKIKAVKLIDYHKINNIVIFKTS